MKRRIDYDEDGNPIPRGKSYDCWDGLCGGWLCGKCNGRYGNYEPTFEDLHVFTDEEEKEYYEGRK